jgi:Siphovirus Gp157
MKTLLDISTDLLELQQTLESLEDAPEEQAAEVADWFAALEQTTHEERDRKLDNYCALIAELEARAAARKVEAKRLSDRAKVDENKAKSLKSRLHEFFETHQLKTVETVRYRLSLVSNGGQLPIVLDESYSVAQMPEPFVQVSHSPNMDAIRQALQAGEVLEFARLGERGKSIRIK